MFNPGNDGNELISYADHNTVPTGPLFSELYSPIFTLEDPSYIFNFPSPFFPCEEDIDSDFLQNYDLWHHQQPSGIGNTGAVADTFLNVMDSCGEDINGEKTNKELNNKERNPAMEEGVIRTKSSKRDRHSKIYTAQGPRDRRMRMSLGVARQFFALQDMLGFDKASKTVEWLLTQADDEIKKLSRSFPTLNQSCSPKAKSVFSSSDCEAVTGNEEKEGSVTKEKRNLKCFGKVKKKKVRQPRKTSFQPRGRDTREKARARARERTKEKIRSRRLNELRICDEIVTNHDRSTLGSRDIPFHDAAENSGFTSHTMSPSSLKVPAEVEERCRRQNYVELTSEEIIEDPVEIMRKWSPSSAVNYRQSAGTSQEVSSRNKSSNLSRYQNTLID